MTLSYLLGLWWVWLSAALAFAILETLIPAYVFLVFTIGAALVAVLLLAGLSASAAVLLAIFAVASLVAWIVLKRSFKAPRGQVKHFTSDIND